jgi:acyl-coenzyme A synthetase/AMP-(fatty) acid ligase
MLPGGKVFDFPPGSIVAVDVGEPALHVGLILALMRLGVASASTSGSPPAGLGIHARLTDRSTAQAIGRSIPVDLTWTDGDGTPVQIPSARAHGAHDLCRVILTSGTTGIPKGVGLSQRLLLDRIARHLTVFGNRLPACSRIFCDMNLRTSLGIQFLMYTLLRGGTFFFAGDVFEKTLEALEEYKVDCAVASPGGLETLLRFYEAYPLYQSKLEVMITAGDMLSKALSRRVRARVCAHVVNVYGSTEASVTATAPAHLIAEKPGAAGFVAPGVSVEVVDESGRVLPPESPGVARVRSAFAVDRYVGSPPDAESPFREGWFYPGDLGAVTGDGLLVLSGRQKTVLSVGGDKMSPELLEAALGAYEGLDECAVFSVPNQLGNDQIWAALVANTKFNEQRLQELCRSALAVQFVPTAFVLVDKLARNEMGKIERQRLRELAAAAPPG